jgi:branched-chain amino acid transport system substrate-binding protein
MQNSSAHGRTKWCSTKHRAALLVAALGVTALPAQAEIPGGVVKIGVLTDMSGSTAENSGKGSVIAAQLAVQDAGGKAGGAPVEVVAADHQNKPDVGSAVARQWLDRDNVAVIVDLPFTQIALAVAGIAKERDRAVMVDAAASSDLTGPACSPVLTHWTDDTYALANGTARALTKAGGKNWFFITADYAFGQALQRDATAAITAEGGRVVGSVRHPLPSADMSSYITQAMSSGAQVVGLANVGTDTSNAIKQAAEFGLGQNGQKLAGLLVFINDVHALGLPAAQGLNVTSGFYWDRNDASRSFAERFRAQAGKAPSKSQAAVYASVRHWLRAVDKTDSISGVATTTAMKASPADYFGQMAKVREDGRVLYDLGLYQVKTPQESHGAWDYYRPVAQIPAAEAFRPLAEGGCPMVAGK